jgi:hypothetical protein
MLMNALLVKRLKEELRLVSLFFSHYLDVLGKRDEILPRTKAYPALAFLVFAPSASGRLAVYAWALGVALQSHGPIFAFAAVVVNLALSRAG